MTARINDLRIAEVSELPSPKSMRGKIILGPEGRATVLGARRCIGRVFSGDERLFLAAVGPCSLHDVTSAMEYARRLAAARKNFPHLFLVMRAYVEKPRSRGDDWPGLLFDPRRDGTEDIREGIHVCRRILTGIAQLGVPVVVEFLDPMLATYYTDTVSWGTVGARCADSPIHRRLASGASPAFGFKNALSGDLKSAILGIHAASLPRVFLGTSNRGHLASCRTKGNRDTCLILRGYDKGVNHDPASVAAAMAQMNGLLGGRKFHPIVIDSSHGNATGPNGKDHALQATAWRSAVDQRCGLDGCDPNTSIVGAMLESHIKPGKQAPAGCDPDISITDPCIGWEETLDLLGYAEERLASIA